jgi:hypothetical protein
MELEEIYPNIEQKSPSINRLVNIFPLISQICKIFITISNNSLSSLELKDKEHLNSFLLEIWIFVVMYDRFFDNEASLDAIRLLALFTP